MAPDRDQLRAMVQKDRESFKEYAQRWREVASQVIPPMEEKEMTKIFLKTLGAFYYERMVASSQGDFTEMVGMGVHLEEAVCEGRLSKDGDSSNGAKKYGDISYKNKEQDSYAILRGRQGISHNKNQQVASMTPVVNETMTVVAYQRAPQQGNQGQCHQRKMSFDPIPMTYTELYPSLLKKNLVQTRARPVVPEKLPRGYKADASYAFHQDAPRHDLEDCFALKAGV